MTVDVKRGIVERSLGLFSVIDGLPEHLTDAELDGLLSLLPADVAANLAAILAPEARTAGLAFLQMLKVWLFEARDAKARGHKIVLVPFNFPPDLIHAFDTAFPLTTEVLTTLAAVALPGGGARYWDLIQSLGLPDHVCSSNSVEVASVLSGLDLAPDVIISAAPGACDANSKVHELLSEWGDIPQLLLEIPVDDTPEGRAVYKQYFHRLIADLEALTGETLTEQKLRRVATVGNRCAERFWDLFELRQLRPSPAPSVFNLFLAGARFCMWGRPEAERLLEAMVETARARAASPAGRPRPERARVFWPYTSYYFDLSELHGWMDREGLTMVADVLSLYAPKPIDTSSREALIDGFVDAAWDYPMNKQMGRSSMSMSWVADAVQGAQALSADCAVYSGHDACKQTWSVVSILAEELKKRAGIPTLLLHGDSWLPTTTPISAVQQAIDEFVGNVVGKRSRPRRRLRKRRSAAPTPGAENAGNHRGSSGADGALGAATPGATP